MYTPAMHLCQTLRATGFLVIALGLGLLASCASSPSASPGEVAANPPEDFWIGVTILGPERAPAATAALARAMRPGRYVVEADRFLRVSLGTGAKETSFPPRTRLLTTTELAELWQAASAAGFLNAAHPNVARGNGEVDPETIVGKTVYVITTHASGRRELLVMETDPECSEWCEKARGVVEWMAGKAWMNPPTTPSPEKK
jgi:hypothetical protein